jgi:inorganic triphosphatase YgiF
MANEVELKLLIVPDDIERLSHHSVFETVARRELLPQQLLSVYYDTPGLDLKKHRTALRLRRSGNRWIQTVKTEGSVMGGLHERPEWESETAEDTLDLAAIGDPRVREFFAAENLRDALRPVFVTEFTRTSSLLEFAGGEIVELSFDQGEIRAEGKQLPICEVELELKAGNPARLFELALALQETIPLKLENVSKAERGYRLLAPVTLTPVKAQPLELSPDLSVSDAFVRILQSELVHLQANEEGVLREEDPEFVHQMRVALRRMRSALSVFFEPIPRESSEPIRTELRWLAGELDAARNWDVLVVDTLPPIVAAFPEDQGLGILQTESESLRRRQNLRAREAVTSDRYQRLLLSLGAWLCSRPWRDNRESVEVEETISVFAARVLQKRHRRLKKRGKHVAVMAPEERHQVRIAAKKLRYAADFFSSLYSRKRVRRYLNALDGLQEVLGALNDAATARLLLTDLTGATEDAAQQQAKSLVLGWVGGKSQAQLNDLARTWSRFVDQKIFW